MTRPGHYNRLASQGPLDRIATGCSAPRPQGSCPSGPRWDGDERRYWPCISEFSRRSRLNSCLKPYWGKPAVRNFRAGGGNTGAPSASPKRLMDIGYPACQHAVRLLSTRGFTSAGSRRDSTAGGNIVARRVARFRGCDEAPAAGQWRGRCDDRPTARGRVRRAVRSARKGDFRLSC
jgi:hypothetical protein